jgi:type II secretory pathway component GspD/PulD (secretin)/tetratricopeptide (TPR) repeat protein
MRNRTVTCLLAVGLLAPLLVSACGGKETISDRRRAQEMDTQPPTDENIREDEQVQDVQEAPEGPLDENFDIDSLFDQDGDEVAAEPQLEERRPVRPESEDWPVEGEGSPRGATALDGDAGRYGGPNEDVFKDLRRKKTLREDEADYYAQRGDDFMGGNQHARAAAAYQKALELNPSLERVRQKLNDSLLIQDDRPGEVASIMKQLYAQEKVKREQGLLEIQRRLDEGKKALAAGDAERAEALIAQAVDEVALQPEFDGKEGREARELLAKVRQQRKDLSEARSQRIRDESSKRAEEVLATEARNDYKQVQTLLRKSSAFLRQREYRKTIEACERILEIDPNNRVAKFWISDAKDQILRERRLQLIGDRVEAVKRSRENFIEGSIPYEAAFVFPDDDEWLRVQARAKDIGLVDVDDPEPVSRIKNMLQTTVDFTIDDLPLQEVVQRLRTITGARLRVDPGIDADEFKVSGRFRNLKAINVLDLVVDQVGLAYMFDEGSLVITNPGSISGDKQLVLYNVSDILNKIKDFAGPELILRPAGESGESPITFNADIEEEQESLDPETLIELIKDSVSGVEEWDEEDMSFHAGQILVRADRQLQAQVRDVLQNLRKDSDLFVVVESRFIDVNDDFLRDVGVDYRGLGTGNNWGTPFGNVINDTSTGGQDLGFVKQGSPVRDVTLIMGQDRWAGRVQNIIDGFSGAIRGTNLSAGGGLAGLSLQATILEPFQLNVILRAVQEKLDVRQLTAPVVTAHNGQRVFVSVITQRAYIADYNLVSGGTGFSIVEVADPEVRTFQEGVILDVDPVVSHDKKYVTLDVRPTLATLIGGTISTILISLGSFTNVANMVPIGVPEIALQQSFTSVTVPNGGTVLLGGFKSLNDAKFKSYIPILGSIPILNNLFRRKAEIVEKRSLVILLSAKIVDLRGEEAKRFNEG